MKATLLAVLAAATTMAVAQPHIHNHQHFHMKRNAHQHQHVVKRVAEPQLPGAEELGGSTIWVCQLGDRTLSQEECEQGIANGTLVSPDGPLTQASPTWSPPPPTSTSTSTTSSTTSSSSPPPPPTTTSTTSSTSSSTLPPAPSTSSTSLLNNVVQAAAATAASSAFGFIGHGGGGGSGSGSGASGVDSDFPDGQISCSDFPDEYGAQSVPWVGLGGWTGVQCPGSNAGGFSNILTQNAGSKGCVEGCYCSYACPAGYQKIQWPSLQGLTGQSVGGLQCKGGKLHLTNTDYSTLCQQGDTRVKVQVQNKLSQNAAVCRTDYPGTESETVPLDTQPGSTNPLTCPNSQTYYFWKGSQTSAQYYVNNAGVSVEDACTWSSAGTNQGNWAPVNLGVSYSNGAAWLAIMANKPTNPDAILNFSIELVGNTMVGKCRYKNGQYCSGDSYQNCNKDGCTVSAPSGTVSYVFS